MVESIISFRTEGQYHVGVYRTDRRIGVIYWGTDKVWCFAVTTNPPDKPIPTITIGEMRDIIGMMCTLDRTDKYGRPADPSR